MILNAQTGATTVTIATPNDIQYCLDKAAIPGSAVYYGLRFAPRELYPKLTALAALERELSELVEGCSDLHVAEQKLAYWADELAGAANQRGSHPVARALRPLFADTQFYPRDTQQLLAAIHQWLRTTQILDEAELMDICRSTAGRYGIISSRIYALPEKSEANASEASATLERIRLIRVRKRAGMPAHASVPRRALVEFNVDRAALDRNTNGEGIEALQMATIQQCLVYLRRCLSHQDTSTHDSDRPRLPPPLLSRLKISRHELELALKRRQLAPVPLLPLSRLWVSWRDARRYR